MSLKKLGSAFRAFWKEIRSVVPTEQELSDEEFSLSSSDLPIVLYLNQRLVFDAIATLRGGFSQFANKMTSTSEVSTSSGNANIGFSNQFALLEVGMGRRNIVSNDSSTVEQIIQTPTSLFAQFRKELYERRAVRYLSCSEDLEDIDVGDFVEVRGVIEKHPLIELRSLFQDLLPIMKLANTKESKNLSEMETQLNAFLSVAIPQGSQDCTVKSEGFKSVITVEEAYFNDPTMNNVIDGTFRIFGKSTSIIKAEEAGYISLLRLAPIKKAGGIKTVKDILSGLSDTPFELNTDIHVEGPAIQIIPIAIFT